MMASMIAAIRGRTAAMFPGNGPIEFLAAEPAILSQTLCILAR
jgi:hypothetical protein